MSTKKTTNNKTMTKEALAKECSKLRNANAKLQQQNQELTRELNDRISENQELYNQLNDLTQVRNTTNQSTTGTNAAIPADVAAMAKMLDILTPLTGNERKTAIAGLLSGITERNRAGLANIEAEILQANERLVRLNKDKDKQISGMQQMADIIESFS